MLRVLPYVLIAVAIMICAGYTYHQTVIQGQVELILEEEAMEEESEEGTSDEEVPEEDVTEEAADEE